jgi:hypothetical protein
MFSEDVLRTSNHLILFPYFRRYAHFGPFHLLPFVKKDKKINLSSPENSSVFHVKF